MYPTSIWTGASDNRTANQRKSPDWRDWNRVISEVSAAQTRVNANNTGRDDDTLDAPGAVATKTGLTVVEKGSGAVHKTVFTFDGMSMASKDGTTAGTDGAWGTQLLYTFPVGHILFLGSHAQFPLGLIVATTGGGTGFSDTADFELGVGTVASAQWTGYGLNNATQEDIVTALDVNLTSKTSDAIESAACGTAVAFDGTAAAKTLNLNFRTLDDADHGTTADILTVSGVLTVVWTALGDD